MKAYREINPRELSDEQKKELIDDVIKGITQCIESKYLTPIEELLDSVDVEYLIDFMGDPDYDEDDEE